MTDINRRAFALIQKMGHRPKSAGASFLEGSEKEKITHDWSHKFAGQVPGTGRIVFGKTVVGIVQEKDSLEIGFDGKNYQEFVSLVNEISELAAFKNRVSNDVIEQYSFLWMFEIYVSKKAGITLLDYLTDACSSIAKEHEFFFPIINLNP